MSEETSESTPSEDQVDLLDKTDGFFKPLIQDGAIIMLRVVAAVVLSTVITVTVPAVYAEAQETVTVEVVEVDGVIVSEGMSYFETAKSFGERVFNGAKENVGRIFNPEERITMMKEKEARYLATIADLRSQLAEQEVRLGVEHKYITNCSREVAAYLESIQLSTEGK